MGASDEPIWSGRCASAEGTARLGRCLVQCAAPGDVLALVGPLGAGKTQLVRGLAAGLGVDPAAVASPTFVLVREYEAPAGAAVLVHIDAYRISGAEDLEGIGWEPGGGELGRGAIVAVEWADRVGPLLGMDHLWIELAHEAPDVRRVCIRARGTRQQRRADLLVALRRDGWCQSGNQGTAR